MVLDREALQTMLDEGCSLEEIGRRVERDASTVSYWLAKHGLEAINRDRHLPRGQLDEAVLAELIAEGLSARAIAERLDRSLGTVRHWLEVHGLLTLRTLRRRQIAAAREAGLVEAVLDCPRCGPSLHRETEGRSFMCLRCRAQAVVARRRKVKQTLVAEAGGGCARCGFAESLAALQFHHVDPSNKEFHIGHRGVSRSLDRARAEAAKCILLCANCHAAVEAGDAALP